MVFNTKLFLIYFRNIWPHAYFGPHVYQLWVNCPPTTLIQDHTIIRATKVTGQELFVAVSYSKPALKTEVALVFTNNVNNTLAKWSGLELLLFFCWVHDMKCLLYSRAEISPSWSKWMKPHFWVKILRDQQIKFF